ADERTMREIYLPPFERAVVEGDAYGVMAAYNKVNGYWCSENAVLLDSILRQDWGFAGIVISDWGGTHSTVRAVESGLNVEMPGNRYLGQALLDSVKAGIVSEAVINERVRELLRVRMAIKPIPAEQANVTMTAKPEQAKIAYDVAIKSMVLLKNEGSLLPLDLNKYKKIAVIGENAVRTMGLGGVGAGVKAYNEITPLKGLQDRIGNKAELLYAQGYQGFTRSWGRRGPSSPYHDADPKLMEEAVKVAKDADLVLFIGGNNREVETEGSDRTSIQLPAGQDQLLQALVAANPNVVTVIVAGAPTDLTTVKEISPAIVYSWLSGSEGGHALADILLGAVAPSGKLPMTFPKKLEDSPAYALKNYPQVREAGDDVFVDLTQNRQRRQAPAVHADYSEGLLVGYRWFDTKDVEPLYPFGFGLSYTTFNYANIATDKAKYSSKESIQVTFELSNTGSVAAEEVVQLYVTREDGQVEWPEKELKAFDRVNLKPSETKSVTLSVPVSSLRYWDEATHDWQLEHSTLNIAVGASSRDIKLNTSVQI
ncbi:MAG: glycoside hydrolase family 3 C-terminal domain-containing protein, partial [Prevotellaceae bacterium]|nr:glycoside hydrolase family 3 C-terminal domain-containing protein [Prevotellaceae bacterium]